MNHNDNPNPILTFDEQERLTTLRTHLDARANYQADNNLVDWQAVAWMELVDKMAAALNVVQHSFKPVDPAEAKKYRLIECLTCGWWGSSKLLAGGGAIADTGDHDDCRCPMCMSVDVEEKIEG